MIDHDDPFMCFLPTGAGNRGYGNDHDFRPFALHCDQRNIMLFEQLNRSFLFRRTKQGKFQFLVDCSRLIRECDFKMQYEEVRRCVFLWSVPIYARTRGGFKGDTHHVLFSYVLGL